MSVLQAIVLGITQGITEFAPISSSGHLILVPWLLGWNVLADPDLNKTFDVALHLGTLVGALVYFRADVARYARALWSAVATRRVATADQRVSLALVIGTVPGAVVGATFENVIQERLGAPLLIAAALAVFGVILVAVDRRAPVRRSIEDVSPVMGLWLGVAQALALQPGVSRSGVTMTAARALGLDRTAAARFSFLLSLPIIAGAGLYKGVDLASTGMPTGMAAPFAWGVVASAVSGFAAIALLLRLLRRRGFAAFLVYRLAVAAIVVGVVAAGIRTGGL